ncbi:MAG TPA: type VI secretion system ATPase TssH, partial [Bacteroidetes bacterium]|nr:type VI secretion system ATPase TssH [Bacteroidota bacterium]
VLLDEIEKAHPEVFNILLQLLDEGRLTDSQGRTVNFKNTIVIMTSNLGSQLIQERLTQVQSDEDWENFAGDLRSQLNQLLRQTIRPEFLNRVDEVILFKPLTRSDIKKVVEIQLKRLDQMLAKKEMTIVVTDDAKDWIARLGYDPSYGARPLKRTIQKYVIDALSTKILAGEINDGDAIELGMEGEGKLVFRKLAKQ